MPKLTKVLDEINQVDWSVLLHAAGDASDVPGMLRDLVSDDEDLRYEALYRLCGTVWHQGTVYQASPHVVPFLLDMLRSLEVPDKGMVALLVAELADGVSALEPFVDEDDEVNRKFRAYLKNEGRDFDAELAQGRSYVRATRQAVEPGLELLYPYLRHNEAEVREGVARALAHYPRKAPASIPHLEAALGAESEDYVRDSMDATILELSSQRSAN